MGYIDDTREEFNIAELKFIVYQINENYFESESHNVHRKSLCWDLRLIYKDVIF